MTKVQISELIRKHAERKNGLHDLMEILMERMKLAERGEFLRENPSDKGNGYRPGHAYGHGRKLEFRIPRDRYGSFHPRILAILRDQEEECDRLAGVLYTKGLTQEQVSEWFGRSLEAYYPVLFVDCVHIKVHRRRSVSTEAFYVVLAVTKEGRREVLGIWDMPTKSATGWEVHFGALRERGLRRVGLMVADGISGLDAVVGKVFPGTPLQRCVTHLKRNMLARVRPIFPSHKLSLHHHHVADWAAYRYRHTR